MGNTESLRNVQTLVEQKQEEHGNSWKLLSEMFCTAYHFGVFAKLFETQFFTMWFMILFKLCRISYNPTNVENWVDIQGYAELALQEIDKDATAKDVSG